jgi:hypothetical protein
MIAFRVAAAVAVAFAFAAGTSLAQIPGPPGGQPTQPAQPQGGMQALMGCFSGTADVKAAVGGKVVDAKRQLLFGMSANQQGAFDAAWASLERSAAGGQDVRRFTRVNFKPQGNLFLGSAVNQQGQPEQGGFYFARVQGNALVVQSTSVDSDGRFATGVYIRQVQGNTMSLRYTLMMDGTVTRVLQGQLQRIDCKQLQNQ